MIGVQYQLHYCYSTIRPQGQNVVQREVVRTVYISVYSIQETSSLIVQHIVDEAKPNHSTHTLFSFIVVPSRRDGLYKGRVRGGHVVKIILSWPQTAPLEAKALRYLMSHDLKMSAKQLLKNYTKRWPIPYQWRKYASHGRGPIETFFPEVKQHFGMGHYQIRTLKGIKRLMLMIQFVYLYLKRMTPNNGCMGESLRQCNENKNKN